MNWHHIVRLEFRVRTERSTNNIEWDLIEVKSPKSLVISSGIQVPHMETLGQCQPSGEVLGVLHGDEEDVSLVTGLGEELKITGRLFWIGENIGLTELKLQQLFIRLGVETINIVKFNISDGVEGPLFEIDIMKVCVHVEAGGSEVVGA